MASCLFPVKLCMKYGWSQDFAVDASTSRRLQCVFSGGLGIIIPLAFII